jgi:Zn-dependent peptidase ImmA (M78 family)
MCNCVEVTTRENRDKAAANVFARQILMPDEQFKNDVRNGINDIENLADKYGVPTLAVRIRAKELGMRGHGLL